jgi:hypothetical protein
MDIEGALEGVINTYIGPLYTWCEESVLNGKSKETEIK